MWCLQAQDDKRDTLLSLDDLLPKEPVQPISYDTLQILLGMVKSFLNLGHNAFNVHILRIVSHSVDYL